MTTFFCHIIIKTLGLRICGILEGANEKQKNTCTFFQKFSNDLLNLPADSQLVNVSFFGRSLLEFWTDFHQRRDCTKETRSTTQPLLRHQACRRHPWKLLVAYTLPCLWRKTLCQDFSQLVTSFSLEQHPSSQNSSLFYPDYSAQFLDSMNESKKSSWTQQTESLRYRFV